MALITSWRSSPTWSWTPPRMDSDERPFVALPVYTSRQFRHAGIFVHGAPWSVADQGKRNVSHGCPNLSPADAQWFFDNFGSGDPVVVKNSVGTYTENDGAQDWQI